jgi:hypothetical protein
VFKIKIKHMKSKKIKENLYFINLGKGEKLEDSLKNFMNEIRIEFAHITVVKDDEVTINSFITLKDNKFESSNSLINNNSVNLNAEINLTVAENQENLGWKELQIAPNK